MNPDINIENFPYSTLESNANLGSDLRNYDAVVFIAPDVSDIITFTEAFFAEDETICPVSEESDQESDCSLPSLYLADGAAHEDFLTFINNSELTESQKERISGSRPV